MKKAKKVEEKKLPPCRTPDEQEKRMISLSVDLAEKQLAEGTASSQVITHFLKLGSTRNQLEVERLRRENELLAAKTEAIKSQKVTEELYANAIKAMQKYQGISEEEEE